MDCDPGIMPSSPDTILTVNDFSWVNGGTAQVALAGLRGLSTTSKELVFLYAVGPPPEDLLERGVQCVGLGQQDILSDSNRARAMVRGLWNTKAARTLKALLHRRDPARTIVHVHGWSKALSGSIFRVARQQGFPILLTLHDYFAACPNGGLYNYRTDRLCTLRPLGPRCLVTNCDVRHMSHKAWRLARQYVQRYAAGLPGHIQHYIYTSETARSLLKSHLPGTASFYRVDNPIPMEQAPPAAVSENSCFVFLGRLAREKGIGLFAEAVTAAGVEGVVIGSGPEEEALRRAFPSIRWTGWQSPDAVRTMLRKARCLVFPSVLYETQGLVVREAAALGVPAIVSDVTAAREWVDPGRNGLLFASGSPDSLTEKIVQLRDNDSLAATLGKEAYRRYWDRPTTTADHAEALLGVYEKVLASPR